MLTVLFLTTIVLELALFVTPLWRIRIWIISILAFCIPAITVGFIFEYPTWICIVITIVSATRLFNLFRIAANRMHAVHMQVATLRTSIVVNSILLGLIAANLSSAFNAINLDQVLVGVALTQAVVATGLLLITLSNIAKTKYRQGTNFYADTELPTVSVLIPARNETYDLEECLRSLLINDYPKLEIIVLDDCSQVSTSDIIKKFAHDGVRFIKGTEPPTKWLAKNYAYERLREAASGELLLFCGVDTRFGSHTIRALVTELQAREKDMISILPRRLSGELSSAFIQPMRYWWELALPRKLLNRPAVLSTCWMIRSHTLNRMGGFASNSRSIIPERHFARKLVGQNKYSFIRANDTLDVGTKKTFHDQQSTAIRIKYPQLSKRPETVLLIVLAELLLFIGPFVMLGFGIIVGNVAVWLLAAAAITALVSAHVSIVYITNPPNSVIALWNFPLAAVSEIAVTIASMVRYEFGEVTWKDRNVCIPVMQVVPRLPKS